MDETKKVGVGDEAPDFTLKDQHNQEFTLSELKGKKVLLSFHPLAWTGICAKQMKSLEDYKAVFDNANTVVAKKYGIFLEEKGISGRVNIILDEDQKVVFIKVYEISQLPDIEEIYNFLRQ